MWPFSARRTIEKELRQEQLERLAQSQNEVKRAAEEMKAALLGDVLNREGKKDE